MVYAHTSPDGGTWEPLCDHLHNVACLCAEYCLNAHLDENEGYVAGLCHDLGKSGHLFQEVLRGRETRVDHESPGAYWIIKKLGMPGYDAALAIHAHVQLRNTDRLSVFCHGKTAQRGFDFKNPA